MNLFLTKLLILPLLSIFLNCITHAQENLSKPVAQSQFKIEQSLEIAKVPAGFRVGFSLLTTKDIQYVAYFDAQRHMTVASRSLDSNTWQYQILPSKVGWDSHNYITMAVDDDGYLHVSGNMHADPLIYFRMEKPKDISSLKKFPMTGENEKRCTYPKFIRDHLNRLIFHYRDGGSGNGKEIYNIYDSQSKTWTRLLDKPLADGQGKMNAYMRGPTRGSDGWFHLVWLWRDAPDCATNHHLSYAKSKDLIHWESAFQEKVELPITLDEKKLWVDPSPSGGGMINGGQQLTFDKDDRPIITYHKSDTNGNMQVYASRPENGQWVIRPLTDWSKPVKFSGNGSMGFIGISISGLSLLEPGIFTMTYRHRDYGNGRLMIDEKTLRPIEKNIKIIPEYPKELNTIQSDFEGMSIRRTGDLGSAQDDGIRFILQWETLGANRDRPRSPPLPEPSTLKLYKLSKTHSK